MNYVSHTRAAHQQLASQADARPQHVSLYWALFFQWNASHFAQALALDHASTMQAARIGNTRTYRATLYDLDAWGLISYQPSKSRHQPSTCQLANLSGAEVPPVKAATEGRSAPDETGLPEAEVPQALRAEVPPIAGLSGALLPQDSLLGKTSFKTPLQNVGSGTKKNRGEGFADDGLSGAEVLDDNRRTTPATAPPNEAVPAPGAAPKKTPRVERGAPKKMRIKHSEGVPEPATADAPRRKASSRQRKPEVPFADSELATYEQFAAAFAGTDYELADLRFYHEKVRNWRQQGEEPRRRDWKATATQFFLNDAQDNRLKLAPGVQHHHGSPGAAPGQPGGPAAEYRSSRWD
ncbi:hypothetical protein [Hymenobacter lapidiphilus]|uniref:Uncharacterized protein n=1 Tax=Hymenobacter lapidiphilus TaxID=2608003 RepID=A0A7Y7PLZ3_9BACT|nr:hypothetical protein [Hymenobacter lapidiphilus]NVO30251.1 hypothetical protein [Hymenobacter lapidiphilus]